MIWARLLVDPSLNDICLTWTGLEVMSNFRRLEDIASSNIATFSSLADFGVDSCLGHVLLSSISSKKTDDGCRNRLICTTPGSGWRLHIKRNLWSAEIWWVLLIFSYMVPSDLFPSARIAGSSSISRGTGRVSFKIRCVHGRLMGMIIFSSTLSASVMRVST